MERVILHSDLNNFFASVECLHNPAIRNKPVIVCGRTEERHGIVLAKNNIAKGMGIVTGEPINQAKMKCREAVEVHPDYHRYEDYSRMASQIYSDYSDRVENFGIDECWIDLSGGLQSGEAAANDIRRRMKKETGLTVSVGVSFNKIFAKLGSDMKKPDAVTVISRDNFREKVWRLPAADLFGVGRVTDAKLKKMCIHTIGDIAQTRPSYLKSRLGKAGEYLWAYANGYDTSPVSYYGSSVPLKSISNGITPPADLVNSDDVKRLIYYLTEEVGSRLREQKAVCSTVAVDFRFTDLSHIQRQSRLNTATNSTAAIAEKAYEIYLRAFPEHRSFRSLTVRVTELFPQNEFFVQTDLFGVSSAEIKKEKLDMTIDQLRSRFGSNCIRRAVLMTENSKG